MQLVGCDVGDSLWVMPSQRKEVVANQPMNMGWAEESDGGHGTLLQPTDDKGKRKQDGTKQLGTHKR